MSSSSLRIIKEIQSSAFQVLSYKEREFLKPLQEGNQKISIKIEYIFFRHVK